MMDSGGFIWINMDYIINNTWDIDLGESFRDETGVQKLVIYTKLLPCWYSLMAKIMEKKHDGLLGIPYPQKNSRPTDIDLFRKSGGQWWLNRNHQSSLIKMMVKQRFFTTAKGRLTHHHIDQLKNGSGRSFGRAPGSPGGKTQLLARSISSAWSMNFISRTSWIIPSQSVPKDPKDIEG